MLKKQIITNTTAAAILNSQLQPYRSRFFEFYSLYATIPLNYNGLFEMFSKLYGSVPFILNFVREAKINSSLLNPEILQKLNLFSAQDQSYYAESIPKQTDDQVQKFVQDFLAYLASNGIVVPNTLLNSSYLNMLAEISISDMTSETRNA